MVVSVAETGLVVVFLVLPQAVRFSPTAQQLVRQGSLNTPSLLATGNQQCVHNAGHANEAVEPVHPWQSEHGGDAANNPLESETDYNVPINITQINGMNFIAV